MRNYGRILILLGLIMVFRMVRVSSFGFYRIGSINTTAIAFILLLASLIGVFLKPDCDFTYIAICASCALLLLSLLLSMHIYFAYNSLLDVLLVFLPIAAGIGITFRERRKK